MKKGSLKIILVISFIISILFIFFLSFILLKSDKSSSEDQEMNNLSEQNKVFLSNEKLSWPLETTKYVYIGYPDIDSDGKDFNCKTPGYKGHEGTDIDFSIGDMNKNISVLAALDGQVLWVFNGKYDRCPSFTNPECKAPNETDRPGLSSGYRVCTELGNYHSYGKEESEQLQYWCFNGGNLIVIRHYNNSRIFATRYDHLKNNSILVKPGDYVKKGQKIAEVGSSGKSDIPHLHFEVWERAFYDLVDPWAGECGPNFNDSLWENQIDS
jgi:murein DD-endopeptidase MepM/ murein hydrolase activator NlpD